MQGLVRLLPQAPSPVAALVQRQLRQADEAGRLALDSVLESAQAVLLRPEKALALSQLSWLESSTRRHPDRLGAIITAITIAFGHPSLDVQRRAASIVERRLSTVDDMVRKAVVDEAASLPSDLRQALGAAVPPEPAPPLAALMVPARQLMPGPIGTVEELAEDIAGLLRRPRSAFILDADPVALERVLAALVGFARTAGAPPARKTRGRDSWNDSALAEHAAAHVATQPRRDRRSSRPAPMA